MRKFFFIASLVLSLVVAGAAYAYTIIENAQNVQVNGSEDQMLGFTPTPSEVRVSDGTASAPTMTFVNDRDTGLYRIGNNNLGVAVNGTKILDVSTTGLGITGTLTPTGNILPSIDLTYNLGSDTMRWLNIYGGTLQITGVATNPIIVGDGSTSSTLTKNTFISGQTSSLGVGKFYVDSSGNVRTSGTYYDSSGNTIGMNDWGRFSSTYGTNALMTSSTYPIWLDGALYASSTAYLTNTTSTNSLYSPIIGINSEYFTDLTGTGLLNTSNVLTLDTSGDWGGTFDSQQGSYYLDAGNLTNFGTPFYTYFSATTTDYLTQGSTNLYNQTHTGEVTGATALTVADNIIDEANLKLDTSPTNNYLLVASSSASGGMDWMATSSPLLGLNGGGTVTSVGMTVPTGLSISGQPITTAGTLALTLTSGYSIPTDAKQTEWDNKWDLASSTIGVAYGGTASTTLTGILKGNGTGGIQTAVAGTDYAAAGATTNDWGRFATTYNALSLMTSSTSPIWLDGALYASSTVSITGDLNLINAVPYAWPSSQGGATTYLKNDGAGTLTWSTVAGTTNDWGRFSSTYGALAMMTSSTYPIWFDGAVYASSTVIVSGLLSPLGGISTTTLDSIIIGGSTPAAGSFTTLSSTGAVTLGNAVDDTITVTGRLSTLNVSDGSTATSTLTYNTLAVGVLTGTYDVGKFYVDSSGNITASGTLAVTGNTTLSGTVSMDRYVVFTYNTSTAWTGTTTIYLAPAYAAETWAGIKCETDTGTVNVSVYDGTNRMNLVNASTTIGSFTYTTNNTFTANESRRVDIGTPATSPTKVSCKARYKGN